MYFLADPTEHFWSISLGLAGFDQTFPVDLSRAADHPAWPGAALRGGDHAVYFLGAAGHSTTLRDGLRVHGLALVEIVNLIQAI